MASLRQHGLLLVLLGGCAAADDAREGGDDAGLEDPYRLTWVDGGAIRMSPGDATSVGVLYVDPDGVPAIDTVSFALVGSAQDASLSSLEAETDANGGATVDLVASSIAASFRLRASAPLAEEIFLDVAVSDSGFGDVLVTPRFVGHREIEARDARLLTGIPCAELDALVLPPGDRSVPVDDAWTPVLLPGLAAGPTYTAVVTGSVAGSVVAYGCTDGLTVADALQTDAEVVVDDLEPTPSGEYDVHTVIDLLGVIPGQPSTWLEPTRNLLTEEGDPTGYLVARIADYVEATYDADARERFLDAMGVDSTLRLALSTPERDPLVHVDAIAADVEAALSQPVLLSTLAIDPMDGAYQALHDVSSIEIPGASIDLEADAPLAFADLSVVSQGAASVTFADGSIDIGTHELELPLGTIAAAIADRVLPARDGAIDLADLVSQRLDCADVAQQMASVGAGADCDVTCLAAGCLEACVHLASSIQSDLSAADESFSRLVISGHATLLDEGGDLRAEKLLSGSWLGTISPAELECGGSFVGERIEEPAE